MKISQKQLKQIIEEEVKRFKKIETLENKKKNLQENLNNLLNEKYIGGEKDFNTKLNGDQFSTFYEPKELGRLYIDHANISWGVEFVFREIGISEMEFFINKINIFGSVEKISKDEDGESEFTNKDIEFTLFPLKDKLTTKFETLSTPFYISNIEINMKNTLDKSKWEIQTDIGF